MSAISENTVSIVLTGNGVRAVRSGHPWLYNQAVARQNKEASSGDIAVLYDEKRKFTGIGLYDAHSPIVVRVLHSGKPLTIDKDFIKKRISDSIKKRKSLIDDPQTTGYRLLSGENDKLAGVVVDVYESVAVLKLDSMCWHEHVNMLVNILVELIKPESIVLRLSRTVQERFSIKDGTVIFGKQINKQVVFLENGIKFYASPIDGQKTGFFLDQRENRAKVGELASGLDVLNVFSYTGGFSLYAAYGGAKAVSSLDISKPALDEGERNFQLNDTTCPHHIFLGDAFDEMSRLIASKKKYGMVIVDPPSFARKQADVSGAIKAYIKLNKLAVKLLDRDGILVAASCSARVGADEFYEAVIKSVKSSGRRFSEIARTQHAIDHPVGFKEGSYLKCIYIKVI